jgi:hypothetical protein
MRTHRPNGIAGNCCCLIPVVILLVIFVAAVIVAAFVWQRAVPNIFRLESAQHHSAAYRDGYEQGNRVAAEYAARGEPEPTAQDVDDLAIREADKLHVTHDRRHWLQGFRSGLARGFESFGKQAARALPAKCRKRSGPRGQNLPSPASALQS